MWYKNHHKMAVRRAFGDKKQIFTCGSRDQTKAELQQLGKMALAKLHGGEEEADVAQWCKECDSIQLCHYIRIAELKYWYIFLRPLLMRSRRPPH